MQPRVRFKLADGRLFDLGPGDIIGRSDRAALCLIEPHISEAHAMVSLRSGELRLLALRGRFTVDGKISAQVALQAGQRVVLASRTALEVEDVRLPAEVFGLSIDGGEPVLIPGVCGFESGELPRLWSGFLPEAKATLWTSGERLFARVGDEVRELTAGDVLTVDGHVLRIEMTGLDRSHAPTLESSELGSPLHLILNFDTVHIIAGPHRLTLDGISARIVSELAAIRAPVAWQEVAKEIWGRESTREGGLRDRWDSSLARLRRKLAEARIRTNLVHVTRFGHIELVLGPGDTLEDRL